MQKLLLLCAVAASCTAVTAARAAAPRVIAEVSTGGGPLAAPPTTVRVFDTGEVRVLTGHTGEAELLGSVDAGELARIAAIAAEVDATELLPLDPSAPVCAGAPATHYAVYTAAGERREIHRKAHCRDYYHPTAYRSGDVKELLEGLLSLARM